MFDWTKTLVGQGATLREVIQAIDSNSMQIAVVVDQEQKLMGIVTDGDIRRGLLKGVGLDDSVSVVVNPNPTFVYSHQSRESIYAVMRNKQINHIPIVDEYKKVVGVETLSEFVRPSERKNWVVLMVGGLGTRLAPLTESTPKPLLNVGGKPLLETILESFIFNGFRHFYFSVNYKAEMIENYFGDGSKWGVEIRYLRETKRLGTAGSLGLIKETPEDTLIIMNGDLLTKVNFVQLINFHLEHRSMATMCVRDYEYQVPYGVVNVKKHRLLNIEEKPIQHFFVNAGIYVLQPEVLGYIPKDTFYDMPSLFDQLFQLNFETSAFPLREYWLDIGRMDDFDRANSEFEEVFG
jgi:dTDP-glucose pyrophosphorylase